MNIQNTSKILGPAFSLSDPWELKRLTALVSVDFPDVRHDEISTAVRAAMTSSENTFSRKNLLRAARASLRARGDSQAPQAA